MFKKSSALYRSLVICLLTVGLLAGCATSAPHQTISEAKQALSTAQSHLKTPEDKANYQDASQLLIRAEASMSANDYTSADFLSRQSLAISRQLIQKKTNSQNNIKFRYSDK